MATNLLAFAPPVAPWLVGGAFVAQKDLSLGIGYYVQQRIGNFSNVKDLTEAPISSRAADVRLYYQDCFTPVAANAAEPVVLTNEIFDVANSTFSYEFDIVPSLLNGGNMTSFETPGTTGESIGHIEFCSIVFMQLDGADISYRKTMFDLKFDLSNNTFSLGDDVTIALPQQTFTLSPNITVNNVVNNTDPQSLVAQANIVNSAITNILGNITLPQGFNLVVQNTAINGIQTSLLGGRRLDQEMVNLFVALAIEVVFECITDSQCDAQNLKATDIMEEVATRLYDALQNGDMEKEIQKIGDESNATYFSNSTMNNTTGVIFETDNDGNIVFNIGELQAALPQFFNVQILDQFTISACHCDVANYQCYTTTQTLGPSDTIGICLTRNADEVFIVQMEMKMEGDNGYEFYPVTYGSNGYYEPHPIFTQIQNFDSARILMVKTNILAGFSTINGGASSITISGNAMLESKKEGSRKLQSGDAEVAENFRMTVPFMNVVTDDEEGTESKPFWQTWFDFLLDLMEFFMALF